MRRAIVVVAAATLVIMGACGTGEDPGLEGPPPTDTSTPGVTATSNVHSIEIRVEDGKPVGGVQREKVEQGETVRILVSSDVADEIHLHGYNKSVDIAAGGQASLSFTANIPGVFIVELEEHGEHILEIEVK